MGFIKYLFTMILLICLSCASSNSELFTFSSKWIPPEVIDRGTLYETFVATVQRNFINEQYGQAQLDTLGHPDISTLLERIDPHSRIVHSQKYDSTPQYGIGIFISKDSNAFTVSTPKDGSPALYAGVLPGDTLLSIDSVLVNKLSYDSTFSLLMGKKESICMLKIKRAGSHEQQNIDLAIQRDTFHDAKGMSRYRVYEDSIGYIRIESFTDKLAVEMESACDSLLKNGIKAMVLDVRNNSGGLLPAVLSSASFFVKRRSLIMQARQLPQLGDFNCTSNSGRFSNIPIVLIVNEGTTSGAEVFAAALKDNGRAVVVGSKSSGNARLQTRFRLDDSTSVKLTTGRFLTPKGVAIDKNGIMPDIIIKNEKIGFDYGADSSFSSDLQLSTAIATARNAVIPKNR